MASEKSIDSTLLNDTTKIIDMPKDQQKYSDVISVGSTVINLLLATGPFSIPYAFNQGGIILGPILFFFAALFSYITSEFMIENISLTNAALYINERKSESDHFQSHPDDSKTVNSKYFIRSKLEIAKLSHEIIGNKACILFSTILTIFILGSILFKVVMTAKLCTEELSYWIYHDTGKIEKEWPIDPYFIIIGLFAVCSTIFAVGNIENSKGLQKVSAAGKFITIALMIAGSVYVILKYPNPFLSNIKLFNFENIHLIFGNIFYVCMFHHSISGILYPLRPQSKLKGTFFFSILIGFVIVLIHCILAEFAFGGYSNSCTDNNPNLKSSIFPCKMQEMYSENLIPIPIVGLFVNLYPIFNVAVVVVLSISLRNNLYYAIFKKNPSPNEGVNRTKVISTLIITVPMYFLAFFMKTQLSLILEITGGLTGVFILLIIPVVLVYYARKKDANYLSNFNRSRYSHFIWIPICIVLAIIVIVMELIKIIQELSAK